MAQLNFNAEEVPTLESRDPIPPNKYVAFVTDSEMKPTNAGDGNYLKLAFEVCEGEHKGRKVWANLNLDNPNPTAVQIAMRELSSICHAVGKLNIQDSTELHNIPMVITVKIEQQTGREPQNKITGYAAYGSAQPQAAAAPAVATRPPAAPAATPPAAGRPAARPFGAPPAAPAAGAPPAGPKALTPVWNQPK